MINHAFHSKKKLIKVKWFDILFIIYRTLHSQLEVQNFKNIILTQSFAVLTREIFFNYRRHILRLFILGKIRCVFH